MSGHICADVTLASQDGLEEDGSDVNLWKGTAFLSNTPVNCEAELDRRVPKSAPAQTVRGSRNGLPGQIRQGQEAKMSSTLWCACRLRPYSGCSDSAQACLGSTPACSPLAQVKAAVAHVRRLKRNQ